MPAAPCIASFVRIIGLAVLALALHGCSTIRFAYNNAASLGYWWIDGYVDFTEAQQPLAQEHFAKLHQWHRGSELPRVAEVLQRTERMIGGELTPQQVCGVVTELRASLMRFGEQAEPSIVALAQEMTPEQFRYLERKQQKNLAEFRKDWIAKTPAERNEKRFKQLVERSEMIYGTLEEPQRAVLRQQVAQSSFDPRVAEAETRRRQLDTVATLRRAGARQMPADQARASVHAYLERMMVSADTAHRAYQEKLLQEFCTSFAVAHNATTPQQRQHAAKRISGYEKDLRELAGQK